MNKKDANVLIEYVRAADSMSDKIDEAIGYLVDMQYIQEEVDTILIRAREEACI